MARMISLAAWRPDCMATGASAGKDAAVSVGDGGDVTDGERLSMALDAKVAPDFDAAATTGRNLERRGERVRLHTCGPHERVRGELFA